MRLLPYAASRCAPLLVFALLATGAYGLDGIRVTVADQERRALLHVPAKLPDDPSVIFCFHGHGGSAASFAARVRLEELWPEAIVVYPDGLPTKTALVDPAGAYSGWQSASGRDADRDIRFFDALLGKIRADYGAERAKVFVAGFSNGGAFALVLLAARGSVVAAAAAVAAVISGPEDFARLAGKPVLFFGGRKDTVVPFAWQRRFLERLLSLDGCVRTAAAGDGLRGDYAARSGAPISIHIDDGGHEIPESAPRLIIDFFKALSAAQ